MSDFRDAPLHTNNQLLSLTDQLNLGVRSLEIDTHWVSHQRVGLWEAPDVCWAQGRQGAGLVGRWEGMWCGRVVRGVGVGMDSSFQSIGAYVCTRCEQDDAVMQHAWQEPEQAMCQPDCQPQAGA